MPYVEKLSLEGADAAARADEIYGLVDGALTAHPAWSKVTDAYDGNMYFSAMDVWENDASADGYPWYLIVGKGVSSHATYQGRVLLGGALEYDPATNIAKKALRGYNTKGYVDADGYPLKSAGGDEREFPLSTFRAGESQGSYAVLAPWYSSMAAAPVAGNQVRILITARLAWIAWSSPTALIACHGVGTYENMHSETADQRPLAFHAMNQRDSYPAGTVWQDPASTSETRSRGNAQWSTTGTFSFAQATMVYGKVGEVASASRGGPVGSRLAVQRYAATSREVYSAPDGDLLGLSPSDLLIFGRSNGVQIGDTITVDGKTYVSVDTPSAYSSLFVNTQPDN